MKPLVLAAATLLASGTALAADDVHPYIGIQYHWTDFQEDKSDYQFSPDISVSIDDRDSGFGIRGGVMKEIHAANRQVGFYGIELGYVDLGEDKASWVVPSNTALSGTAKVEIDGFELAAIGGSEIWYDTYLYGRLGLFKWDANGKTSINAGLSGKGDDSGTDFVVGAGLMYFIDQFQIRGGYDLYRVDIDDESNSNIGVINIGGQFAF